MIIGEHWVWKQFWQALGRISAISDPSKELRRKNSNPNTSMGQV